MVDIVHELGTDYTTPLAWWSAECATYDYISNATRKILECPAGSLNHKCDLQDGTGYNANSTYKPIIRAKAGHEHDGIPGAGFVLYREDNYDHTLGTHAPYLEVSGIEIKNTSSTTGRTVVIGDENVTLDSCILQLSASGSSIYNYVVNQIRTTTTVRNCLTIGGYHGYVAKNNNIATVENCVAVRAIRGFNPGTYATQKMIAKNCVGYDNVHNFYEDGGGYFLSSSTNNAASDGLTVTPPGSNPYTSDVVASDFVDAANDDYHLSPTSGLIGQGVNLYSEFTADIDGDALPSAGAWNIGFDHIPAGGGGGSVTSDLDLRWDVLAHITSDIALRWDILNAIDTDIQLAWDLLSSATSDKQLAWDVLNQVTADQEIDWSIREAVYSDVDLSWDIQSALMAVTSDLDLRWNLLNKITSNQDLQWQIRNAIETDLQLGWDMLNVVTNDQQLAWNILQAVTRDLDLQWNIDSALQSVTRDLDLNWNIRNSIVSTLDTQSDILNVLGVDLEMRWDIANAVVSELNTQYDVLNSVSTGAVLRWDTLNATSSSITFQWSVDGKIILSPITFIKVRPELRVIPVPAEYRFPVRRN